MSLATLKLELLREKNEEKIALVKSLGYQTAPIYDITERQIACYLAKNESTRYW